MSPILALDWGTTRARAVLIGSDGTVLARRAAASGIQGVAGRGFPGAFEAVGGVLPTHAPEATIVLCGMVGSRNGWVEAPYGPCPATPEAIAAAALAVSLEDGTPVRILPGLSCDEGAFDVMRGEETLVIGLDGGDGLVCLPGTHSKWAQRKGGRITRFASFMTGEVYGLLREHSILGRLAEEATEEDRRDGVQRGLAASRRPAGLLNAAFAARTEVLAGRMRGGAVGPYLSALLVGQEIAGARALFGAPGRVDLVAEGELAESYAAALEQAGIAYRLVGPEQAFVAGIRRLAAAMA